MSKRLIFVNILKKVKYYVLLVIEVISRFRVCSEYSRNEELR